MSLAKRTLGRTGLQVTVLGYGAMEIRGPRIWGGRPVTEQQAETILNAVLDAGINFIDTANDYGRSEEFIGKYLSKRRSEFYIATKCGCKVTYRDENTDDTPHEWTRENLFRGLHESLQRLKTDYIDIMQLHNPTVEQCQQGDLVNVLKEMQQQGKVRWIGCSSTLPHIRTYIEWGVFDVFQIPYSALERAHENVITEAAQKGAGIIDRGGVARGERIANGLSASVSAGAPAHPHHHRRNPQPRPSARKCGHCGKRPSAARCLRGGQTAPRRRGRAAPVAAGGKSDDKRCCAPV